MTTVPGPTPRPAAAGARARDLGMLAVFLLISYAVATFGSLTTAGAVGGWYAHSPHVPWTPPGWVFGVVWTVLYGLIAVAEWLVWRRRDRRSVGAPLAVYTIQLALNALWVPVFFGGYPVFGGAALWAGLAIIIVLDLAVAATAASFWQVSKTASLLLLPYLVWLLYATTLNWGDAALNALG